MFLNQYFLIQIILISILTDLAVGNTKECGKQTHKGNTGSLVPRDGLMAPGTKCVWIISPIEPGSEIYLLFEEFNISSSDTILLKNGTSESAPNIFDPINGTSSFISFLCNTKTLTVVVEISSNPNFNRRFRAYFDAHRCGKDLQENVGFIQSPLYPKNLNNMISCQWRFNQSEMIGISFKSFSLGNSTLHVHGSKESDGNYNESFQPSDIFTQQYALISLDLVTSSLSNLELFFVPISSECSSHNTLKENQPYVLELPTENYHSYNCRYIFEAPPALNISLKLKEIKLFENDIVIVNDGNGEFSQKLKIFTSDSKETETITSSHNFLWIAFTTDILIPGVKFKATLTTIKSNNFLFQNELQCGKTQFYEGHSFFGPENGSLNADTLCIWHLRPSMNKFIYIKFLDILMKKGDILQIKNESNFKQVLFGPFTYENKPTDILVSSYPAIIFNVSNTFQKENRTFNAYYIADACGYQINDAYGYLASPKYIPSFRNATAFSPLFCNWYLLGSKMIKIAFEKFNLTYSKLELETLFGKIFLIGNEIPSDMLLQRNAALTLYLNLMFPNEEFGITFFPVEPSCSHMVELNPSNPNYTFNLFLSKFKNYNCALIIYSPLNTFINFIFLELNLGEKDIMTIKDGTSTSSPLILEANSNSEAHFINTIFNTTKNGLLLDFSTQFLDSFVKAHLSFTYNFKTSLEKEKIILPKKKMENSSHPKPCGKQQHSGYTGALNPNDNKFHPNMACKWILTPPNTDDNEIYLRFDLISLFPNDTIQIFKGSDEGGPLIFDPFFGVTAPFTVLTGVHNLTLLVRTDNTPGDRPFQAIFSTLGCGKDIQDDAGMILSPLYSEKRSNKVLCMWRFNVTGKQKLIFESIHIDPEKSQVFLNKIKLDLNHTLHDEFVEPFYTTLTFYLDTSVPNQSWHVSYYKVTPECSGLYELTDFKTSFDFSLPASPFHDISCNWILSSPPNTTIGLTLASFKLNLMDSIIIKDGSSENSPTLYYITFDNDANMTNRAFRSSHNAISIQFLTQFLYPDSHFNGIVFFDKHGGYFKNEGNIEIYNNSLYLLEVEANLEVILTLTNSLPNNGCLFIYADFSFSSQLIRGICSNNSNSAPLLSPSKRMMIFPIFESNTDTTIAKFKGIPKGCFTLSTDNSGSYSLSSTANQNCSWVISLMDKSSIISLQFTYVKSPAKLFTLVGETLITELKENMPIFYIPSVLGANTIIYSQSHIASSNGLIQGFYNKLPKCELFVNEIFIDKQLSSPDYPNSYPLFANCSTIFKLEKPTYLVLLDLVLSPGHKLELFSKNKKIITFNSDSSILEDVILEYPARIYFESGTCTVKNCLANTLKTGSGYLINATSLSCGSLIENSAGSFASSSSLSPPFKCIWILKVPSGMINFTIQWSSKDTNDQEHPGFKIHDGPSVKDKIMENTTVGTHLLSRNNSLVFVYESMTNVSSYPAFTINYHQEECFLNYSMCLNGLCMHPDWICNDQNDCGDWSDERYCNTTWPKPPHPPPPIVYDHTMPYFIALGLGIPLTLLFGFVLGLYMPKAIERWRAWRTDGFSMIINS